MNRNCRRKTEKVYVKVNSDFDATGYMQPRQITWGDGRTYPIEQVRDFRPANTIADMPGDCYTVMVKGQERHLFFERSDPRFPSRFGRWFVEVESASPVFPACAFLMEKQGAKEPELPRICGCQNFAAAAVLPTAFSTGVN